MTQFTCKGVKQINNRISFKHLYHSYLSAFFISTRVPNGESPEILIAKCRSRFYCTRFSCWGENVWEINVSCAWDPVHAGDKALTRETPTKRGRVKRYANCKLKSRLNLPSNLTLNFEFPFLINLFAYLDTVPRLAPYTFMNTYCQIN
jgi:hypothetical protein